MTDAVPRPEYPRPQFVRDDWLCLNGPWGFETDPADDGLPRGLRDRELAGTIVVPFAPESPLSGVGRTEFLHAVWYRRVVRLPAAWAGRTALLHLGACDYDATVWADGVEVARHRGGFTPVEVDLGPVPAGGRDVTVVVRARDPHRSPMPLGKQSEKPENYGCHYTRTTGLWQTVWAEPVGPVHFERPRVTPDLGTRSFTVELPLSRNRAGHRVRATLDDGGTTPATALATADAPADLSLTPRLTLVVPEGHVRPWGPADPHLYGLVFELLDDRGTVVDRLASYAGLRGIAIDGQKVLLNGKSVFQRLVLDQGYYPDGIYTAPTDAALKADIELAMAAGFNGARLHQKVFEERFLYWADRLGYLVWGEFADWGGNTGAGGGEAGAAGDGQLQTSTFVGQWVEAVQRDYSHPCVIGWCPLNETGQTLRDRFTNLDEVTHAMFRATKAIDPTRPVIDASGWSHRVPETDVYDSHDYDQDPATFAARHAHTAAGRPYVNEGPADPATGQPRPMSVPYRGQPVMVSEFGGVWWNPHARAGQDSWGYGQKPTDVAEVYRRFEGWCTALLNNPGVFGYCYTQLTDVYQEQNGLFYFDRTPKFDLARLKAVQTRRAAIETE